MRFRDALQNNNNNNYIIIYLSQSTVGIFEQHRVFTIKNKRATCIEKNKNTLNGII